MLQNHTQLLPYIGTPLINVAAPPNLKYYSKYCKKKSFVPAESPPGTLWLQLCRSKYILGIFLQPYCRISFLILKGNI